MIITRSPLRLPLAGGGTDLDSYYLGRGASWISVAINKYCYSILNKRFDKNYLVKYSKLEEVQTVDEIKHNLVRETLKFFKIDSQIELTFTADIPGSTGLGSSSSFLVSLISAISSYLKLNLTHSEFANISTKIERDILKEPIGLQDQYITALGGLKLFEVSSTGVLSFQDLQIGTSNLRRIQDSLLLIFTGIKRDSKSILSQQVFSTNNNDSDVLNRLDFVKSQVPLIQNALLNAEVEKLGGLFHEHWLLKSKQSKEMSNEQINDLYLRALNHGALGGKLIGAGGGGFLLIVVEDKFRFLEKSVNDKFDIVPFEFEMNGTTTLFNY
jgi:D-glycero-alpha-D-manno-heptose-7-phosphate kinase